MVPLGSTTIEPTQMYDESVAAPFAMVSAVLPEKYDTAPSLVTALIRFVPWSKRYMGQPDGWKATPVGYAKRASVPVAFTSPEVPAGSPTKTLHVPLASTFTMLCAYVLATYSAPVPGCTARLRGSVSPVASVLTLDVAGSSTRIEPEPRSAMKSLSPVASNASADGLLNVASVPTPSVPPATLVPATVTTSHAESARPVRR